jgi:uncharacterized protein YyaL (SSP411 family)
VLLDLEAVWCHWCHVMDAITYRDPAVAALLGTHYVAVKVDQDSRPDLAGRFGDYGWPATIIFGPDGTVIVKRQGYIPPGPMARLLKAAVDDPSPVDYHDAPPEASAAGEGPLAPGRRASLRKQWLDGYDDKAGGWGRSHKFLDGDSVELALREAARGDRASERRARETLRLERRLVDPVWGGVYQYSVGGGWDEPHFEKIMAMEAENLRIYALAYAQEGDAADLAAAEAIHRYLRGFLESPEGAFYTSQDADLVPGEPGAEYFALGDAARRARGVPRVDTHVYARENGWAVAALAQLGAVTGEAAVRAEAERAANWILAHRSIPGGGFRHGAGDAAGPYLGDTLAMGRAFFALYQLTADARWLARAVAGAGFIRGHFGLGSSPGFAVFDTTRRSFLAPQADFDENAALARLAAALAGATGREDLRALAASSLQRILAPGVAEGRGCYVAGLLLAEEEVRTDPLHVAVVGPKDDRSAGALFAAALRAPTAHKLVEWWDRGEGPAPRGEDIYPDLGKAAAFVCGRGTCSPPLFTAPDVEARLQKLLSAGPPAD